jgi:hypothetical protein
MPCRRCPRLPIPRPTAGIPGRRTGCPVAHAVHGAHCRGPAAAAASSALDGCGNTLHGLLPRKRTSEKPRLIEVRNRRMQRRMTVSTGR